ncbi:MAG: hypothetical protein FWH11_02980 [Micrococcales bacterium]|nr:hypothetical protein [Micrococcales bacterium]
MGFRDRMKAVAQNMTATQEAAAQNEIARQQWEHDAQIRERAAADPSSHPMLAPVHGVTLSDYAQICLKQFEGVDQAVAVQAMGFDQVVWDDARATWERRMAEDTTFTVGTEYARLFSAGVTDPRLLAIGGTIVTTNQASLDRLRADRAFTLEISAARSAAANAGLDGNKWMMDTIGVSPTDFQQVEGQWATYVTDLATRAGAGDRAAQAIAYSPEFIATENSYGTKLEEYTKMFTDQAGGGAADDIVF